MAFNGSGTFSLVAGNPVVTGTTISSTWSNNTLSDIASNGLSNVICKDGQTTVTANIPFSGFRLTGIGAAAAATDALRLSQAQNGTYNVLSSVSGTNTITGSLTPAITGYTEGLRVLMIPLNSNTGQATLNVNGIGAAPIFFERSTATASSVRAGVPIIFEYISTTSATGFHILGQAGFSPPVGFKIGSFTYDISSTASNQPVTGVGFKPALLLLFANVNGTSAMSVGMTTAIAQGVVFDDNVDAAGTYGVLTNRAIYLATGAVTSGQASIASMDVNGFTISWTKAGSPTGTATVLYAAFR